MLLYEQHTGKIVHIVNTQNFLFSQETGHKNIQTFYCLVNIRNIYVNNSHRETIHFKEHINHFKEHINQQYFLQ